MTIQRYHVTEKHNAEAILRDGFRDSPIPGTELYGVYLSTRISQVDWANRRKGHGNPGENADSGFHPAFGQGSTN